MELAEVREQNEDLVSYSCICTHTVAHMSTCIFVWYWSKSLICMSYSSVACYKYYSNCMFRIMQIGHLHACTACLDCTWLCRERYEICMVYCMLDLYQSAFVHCVISIYHCISIIAWASCMAARSSRGQAIWNGECISKVYTCPYILLIFLLIFLP